MLNIFKDKTILKPKAVVFDTDNTLYLYQTAHRSAMKSVANKAKAILDVDSQEFYEVFDLSRKEIKLQLGNTASSHNRLLYFQRTIERLGLGTRIFIALDFEQTYWREFLVNTRLFNNVKEFLQQLKSDGIKTANITDLTAQIQFRKMVYFGLDEYFDYVVTSEEAGHDKPDEKIYNMALKKLQVAPSETWMIGDCMKSDIYGANKSGIVSIQKIHSGVEKSLKEDYKPDISFTNFGDLIALYSRL